MKGLTLPLALVLALATAPARADDPVIAAAGNIACDPASTFFNGGLGTTTRCRQKATSDLLVGGGFAAVLPLGDNQYENGSLAQFEAAYEPSWGRVKGLSYPVAGNHDYSVGSGSPSGSGYFDYFNGAATQTGRAGDRAKGYYSYDLGDWHLVALNSVCEEIGGCGAGSAQEQWLRADLAQNTKSCTLAYWHHPRFTSDPTVANPVSDELFRVLHEAGTEIVLSGHAHSYERFSPQDPDGAADGTFGVRQFVVGTGGRNLNPFGTPLANSEARDNTTFGVLKLTLKTGGYDWDFIRESAVSGDSGSAICHGAPAAQAPSVVTAAATSVGGTSARLNAAVNPRGQAGTYRFEYGPTAAYGSTTADTNLAVTTSSHQQVGAAVTSLTPGTTYHYRVVAQNGVGTTIGDDRTFTTEAAGSRYAAAVAATPGLLSHWRLGEASGAFGYDHKGLRLGSYRGAHSLGQPGALVGDPDAAVGFDGASGELRTAGPALTRLASIEGWFLWTGGASLLRDDSWGGGWALAYENDGKLAYRVTNKRFLTSLDIGAVRDGAWHHLALTKDGGTTTLYVDGAVVHTEGGASNRPSTSPWHVMRHGQESQHAAGRADEIAMYDAELSPRTVRGHYDIGRGDLTPPETSVTSGPQGLTNVTSAVFAFESSEALSAFSCKLDGPGAAVGTASDCQASKAYGPLADGTYTFSVDATDPAGNADPTPATRSFTVDSTAPDTAIDTGPDSVTGQANPGFAFTSSEAQSSFTCALDGPGGAVAAHAPCGSPRQYTALADGHYTFRVVAIDAAGNSDPTPATRSFTVDTTAPGTAIEFGPQGPTSVASASFSFSSTEPQSGFTCSLDGPGDVAGAEGPCTSPKDFANLADGDYTFRVAAADAAGNPDATAAIRSFTVDTTAPETLILSGPEPTGTATDATLTFWSPDSSARFECRLNGGAWESCASPHAYTGLATGGHTFEVRATDGAGNGDASPAVRAWTVERPPAPAEDPPANPAPADDPTPSASAGEEVTTLRPASFRVLSGQIANRRTPLPRLQANDARRLEIRAARKRSGAYLADFYARLHVEDDAAATLRELTLEYDGAASLPGAELRVRIYDFGSRRWTTVYGWRSRVLDRRFVISSMPPAAHEYISPGGRILVRVTGKSNRAFRTRTDLIRVTIDH